MATAKQLLASSRLHVAASRPQATAARLLALATLPLVRTVQLAGYEVVHELLGLGLETWLRVSSLFDSAVIDIMITRARSSLLRAARAT
jgi:hypothetical protein